MAHEITRRGILQALVAVAAAAPLAAASARHPAENSEKEIAAERTPLPATKLEGFLRSRGIRPVHFAGESGYSRRHLFRLRFGRIEPALRCVVDLTKAARRITREAVRARDLFGTRDRR